MSRKLEKAQTFVDKHLERPHIARAAVATKNRMAAIKREKAEEAEAADEYERVRQESIAEDMARERAEAAEEYRRLFTHR